MRRCNYELSRVMDMRRWLTVMNATIVLYDSFGSEGLPGIEIRKRVTSIGKEARKLPIGALRHRFRKQKESECLLRQDGAFSSTALD